MYHLQDLLTKVVTIKLITGYEILTKLMGVDEDSGLVTVEHPKIVTIIDGGVSLMPFALTADAANVVIPIASILAVLESSEGAVTDYTTIVKEISSNKLSAEEVSD